MIRGLACVSRKARRRPILSVLRGGATQRARRIGRETLTLFRERCTSGDVKDQRSTAELLQRAAAHQRAGRLEEAESFYGKVLARKPRHGQALFALSALLFEAGRFDE